MERYSRNTLYIPQESQNKIKDMPILFAGCGIGSNIAECALRTGFERLTLVDGDKVEMSNLNRQNYLKGDIKKNKASALVKRLSRINSDVQIRIVEDYIAEDNLESIVEGHAIAVNCCDFKSDIPFKFDLKCGEKGIPVIHPYNFGFGAMVTIIKPGGYQLTELANEFESFEIKMAEYVARFGHFWHHPFSWLDKAVNEYRHAPVGTPHPQLAIGSWLAAGMAVQAMYRLAVGESINYFPKFYISSLDTDAQ